MTPGEECEQFLKEAKALPPETRRNLARHLVGSDAETAAQIEELSHQVVPLKHLGWWLRALYPSGFTFLNVG